MNTQNPTVKLSQSRLKELLDYDAETGVFTRRAGVGVRCSGVINNKRADGYMVCWVDGKTYYLHRLAVLWMTGVWPSEEVDHKNGVRDDNRWVNLREIGGHENTHNNGGPKKHNKSGFVGVHWHKSKGRWRAQIGLNGRTIDLGHFSNPETAYDAYLKAKVKLHPSNLRLKAVA